MQIKSAFNNNAPVNIDHSHFGPSSILKIGPSFTDKSVTNNFVKIFVLIIQFVTLNVKNIITTTTSSERESAYRAMTQANSATFPVA